MYDLILKPSAEKQMDRLPASVRQRITGALEALRINPRPTGCRLLEGTEELWRVRVGNYRGSTRSKMTS